MIWVGTAGIPTTTKGGYIEAIHDLVSMGLNAVEMEFVYGVKMKEEYAEKVGKAKPDDFVITAHAPYYINLCNPEKRDASMERIKRTLDRTNRAKGFSIAVHTGFYGKLTKEKAFEMVDQSVSEIEDWMRENGIKVYLGLETTGKFTQFGSLEELLDLMKNHKMVHPVVDFAHLYARERGKIDFGEVFKKLKKSGMKKLHTHFSGIEYGEKGEKRHLPISSKSPDFEDLIPHLKNWNRSRDVVIICESPLLEKDALIMKEILEKHGLWKA